MRQIAAGRIDSMWNKALKSISPDTTKKFYKWEVVILLWIAFFLNQADRQAFNIVLPQIQTIFGAKDSTMGLITTLFNLFYAVTVPFAGFYADRLSRSRQIILSTFIFGTATLFTGFSNSILLFIIFRCAGMGIGQGMFGPTYIGLIAQYHDTTTRARAMSLHQTSSYVGVITCGVLAGLIADKLGWQYVFYIFGGLSVAFAFVLLMRLRDKKEESAPSVEVVQTAPKPTFGESVAAFFKVPTAICMLIAFTGVLFGINGYLTWMPKYMKVTFDLSMTSAGFHSMFWTNVAAFAGVMIGGTISDRIIARGKGGANRLLVQITGLLLAAPCIVLMGLSHNFILVCAALAGFGFFRGLFESGTYPVLYDVISSKFYSMAAAIMILFGFGIGALAPWILGMIGDRFGLSGGIAMLGVVWLAVSLPLILARFKFYNKDVEKLAHENDNS